VAVLGFALRGMIADVFSGIAINMEHPYRIGDWVQLEGGLVGKVAEINWRATRLTTRDQLSVVVPNGVIAGAKVVNYSLPERHYRAQIKVALPVSVPVDRARRVLLAAVLGAGRVLSNPRPEVQADGFDERGMVYLVRYWVGDYADDIPCRDAVAASVAHGLQQAGLVPAFPRREVEVGRRVQTTGGGISDELHRIPLFRDFAATELDELAARMVERRFVEGEGLFAQGDPGGSLYLLADGVLEVRLDDAVLDRMVPGEVLGEVSLLTGQPRSASVVALTDGVVFEIRKEHVEPILRARPQLAEGLAALMAQRQRHNRERLAARRAQTETPVEPGDLLVRLRAFFGL
ncbi:MAG: mechanosensitive ion channel family protein, partial [Rhodospirillaceae bacterium]|nr:mechanosensitive ion channel family protein [Rhodospirillales bacterium]